MSDVELRLVPPARRSSLAEWEVWSGGKLLGWIAEYRRHGMRATMYRAHGKHPVTSKTWYLNASTEREERIRAILEFVAAPEQTRGHEVSRRD